MFCLDCQKLTLKGDTCSQCNKILPGFGTLPPNLVDKAKVLRDKTVLVRCGDLSKTEFLNWVEQQEDIGWAMLEGTEGDKIDPDSKITMAEELNAGRRAAALLLESCEALRSWIETGDQGLMNEALDKCTTADQLITRAIHLNWEAHRQIAEVSAEFIRSRSGGV
jgi:hypothetical protein